MSILNITNLTNNPKKWIKEKFLDAFNEYERESDITIDENEKLSFIEAQIESLEERADETLGKDLLSLIDNYLVNLDYYSEVKEWYNNK
jgi:spore coat polysaccharide biosynthesis protein SpsF (cytidylyltransferase family)